MQQRVAEVIENVTEDEGPIDLEALDTELPEKLPFVGFDAETDGTGVEYELSLKECLSFQIIRAWRCAVVFVVLCLP